jgi:hypothetical protein
MMMTQTKGLLFFVQAVRTTYRTPCGGRVWSSSSPCRLNEAQEFLLSTTRRLAQGWRFILIGRSCQSAQLTAKLAGSGEPGNLKPLAVMPMRKHQGHAQVSTGE